MVSSWNKSDTQPLSYTDTHRGGENMLRLGILRRSRLRHGLRRGRAIEKVLRVGGVPQPLAGENF
ncbi:MAG: hypothetical protein DRO11_08035 [Methanobacteriota archaeon]|nr:MAG: hypothetical protein DRO11_08035 [Euryarchaeota archaeon]